MSAHPHFFNGGQIHPYLEFTKCAVSVKYKTLKTVILPNQIVAVKKEDTEKIGLSGNFLPTRKCCNSLFNELENL